MRIHGLLTVLALLIIASGFVPQYMGDIGTFTGEHTGIMLADELGTIGDDFDLFFKDGLMTDTLVLEYYDGTEYVTVTDEVAQQFYSYYLLNNDDSQKLYLDGSFDDGVFADLSGNGNHGTPSGGATTGTGVVGDGMSFDGVDDYLKCGSIINGWTSASLSFWIDTTQVSEYRQIIYASAGGGHMGIGILFDSSNRISCEIYTTTGGRQHKISDYIITPNYKYITLVCDEISYKMILYINGEYYEEFACVNWGTIYNQVDVELMAHYSRTSFCNGTLDEIRIYDRALSPEEVEVLNDVPLQMQSWNGYDMYASYEYRDTFAPIATDLFTIGFPVLGIVILVFVGASYLYNN